jgi:predicted glycogen debranching enzyme
VLPNDLGAGSYNTVDASLWFIRAVSSYFRRTSDEGFLIQIWPCLKSVVRRYSAEHSAEGPEFGMCSDGLIRSGPALTWMDARVDGRPVTPRAGKCCEINALWYSDLERMEALARALDEPWEGDLAGLVKESFQRFWNPEKGCLFDVLDPEDASVRPNQILAAAVPGLLPEIKRRSILEVVTRELLTPYGLRTLSPRDPRYVGLYEGGPAQRDAAYHQGTVWPWLIGPYVDALLSVNEGSRESRERAREVLSPLLSLEVGSMGTLPEVFDAEEPHRPGGCISQAWSVGEVLRAKELIEDLG